nr:hypothetical protein [Tanacetum cinerariifolium]GEY73958.1 hypothetical protein [Tanacetum cinerariifolium]
MDDIPKINDPQWDLLLLHSCTGIFRLYFTMRTCPPHMFESAQRSFDVALHSSIERITKLLWHTGIVSLKPIFDDALSVFNTSMETGLLSNPSIPLFSISEPYSACLRVFAGDIYGDHVVLCFGIIGIKHRHDVVRDTLVDICYRYGISAGKEVDIGLDERRGKPLRPTDMLLYSCDRGLDACVDLTGSSPMTQTGMVDFVPGQAVIDAAQRKRKVDAVTLLKRIRKFSMA